MSIVQDMALFRESFAPFGGDNLRPARQEIDENGERQGSMFFESKVRKIGDGDLRSHIDGKRYYGWPIRIGDKEVRYTPVITIDLDVHSEDVEPLQERFEAVCRAFQPAYPISFRSPGGGLHVYFLLEDRFTYLSWAIVEARRRLGEAGIEVKDGSVEILEERGNRRIPLGRGCPFMHSKTLEPVSEDNWECLKVLVNALRDDLIPRLPILPLARKDDPYFAEHYQPQEHPKTSKRSQRARSLSGASTTEKAQDWLKMGLLAKGQRRKAQPDLVCYYMGVLGKTADEACELVCEWLRTKHNGCSASFKDSPRRCYGDIRHLCDTFDDTFWQSWRERGQETPPQPVALNESWISEMKLKPPQELLLRRIATLAVRHGVRRKGGMVVHVAATTLREVHSEYGPHLQILKNKKAIKQVGNHFNPPPGVNMRSHTKSYQVSHMAFIDNN